MGKPQILLDPACGRWDFITAVPAGERWAIDQIPCAADLEKVGIHTIVADLLDVDLPPRHFDAVLLSNIREHLMTYEDVQRCLSKMRASIRPGGVVAVLGPNFKYCADEYFDCADHVLALTHISIQEHLYAAGFDRIRDPALPPLLVSRLAPPSERLKRLYLRLRGRFRLLGKQFLVIAST